ncbi:MAG TPA: phytanoyl-CoA dioxygenase family protein [Gemmataceae bacterium]|nr:phytanoyl-CoA dioxygenase family protein [Gemmataceae bacterium]
MIGLQTKQHEMISSKEIGQFDREGYLLVRNMLTPEQVAELRAFFRPKFNLPAEDRLPGDTEGGLVDIFSRYPSIRWLLFHERLIELMKAFAGDDFLLMPESFAILNSFGRWHKDTTPWEKKSGRKIHWEKGYRMIGFAFYLQDNTEEYGGGLDVEPKSHLEPDPFISSPEWSKRPLGQRISLKVKKMWYACTGQHPILDAPGWDGTPYFFRRNPVKIPNKAGDLVLFDIRVNHRGSQPRQLPVPPEHEKILINGGFVINNRRFIQDRLDYYHSRDGCFYPKGLRYPADFLSEAEAHGIRLATDDQGRM